MSDTDDDAQRRLDICSYGFCWCGEPRRGLIIDTPDGGLMSVLRCYEGHSSNDDPEWHDITQFYTGDPGPRPEWP